MVESWTFSNWLTHAKASTWYDAKAVASTVEHALGLAGSLVVRHVREVPEACPSCGSNRLVSERRYPLLASDVEFERLTCGKCGWAGSHVPILADPHAYAADQIETPPPDEPKCPEEPCVITQTRSVNFLTRGEMKIRISGSRSWRRDMVSVQEIKNELPEWPADVIEQWLH